MMAKICFLKHLYTLSDIQVLEEAAINLAYMWFLEINPEEELPDPSLLAKFRTQRLKETTLDDIMKEIVRQCVEKGIIKGTGISIDCTHTQANTNRLFPERIMKRLAKKILKNLEEENGSIPEGINQEIPEYKEIEDSNKAKAVMLDYLENLMEKTTKSVEDMDIPKTRRTIEKARNILSDPKFMVQKGVRSLIDEDARVGYKTKTDSFFGYKVEFAMIPEEKIITALNVYDGAYVDGTCYGELYAASKDCGITIKEAYADKAYFRQPIIELLERDNIEIYIPISQSVYKMDESRYSYNKDSDQWFCKMGNCTVKRQIYRRKNHNRPYSQYQYHFEKEKCRSCPKRDECIKGSRIAKMLEVSVNTPKFYEYSQREKTDKFKTMYKRRASHEGKNGEMKRFHGMDRAWGYGLKSMRTQAKLTALAVNLKRIAKLVPSYLSTNFYIVVITNGVHLLKSRNLLAIA